MYSSQHGEEAVIEKYIGAYDHGKYVDIGAGYPEQISNTYYFYKKGWRGLCLEPNTSWNEEWKEKRPEDIFINAVVTDTDCDSVTMYDNGMEGSYVGEDRKRLGTPAFTAPGVRFDTLMKKYPQFHNADFISIDVDSGENKVLSTMNFEMFWPKLIVIEYTLRGIDFTKNWEAKLTPFYTLREQFGGNAFYLRK